VRTTSRPDLAGHLRHTIVRVARRMRQEAGGELSTATRVLARLEEEGLIQRTADLYDRRSSLVAVTTKGSELLDELRTRKTAFLAARLETLEPDERATLERAADILERVLDR
jgi:DNA-binding MarR family transcriptional regulator